MVFSSLDFIFLFLPAALIGWALLRNMSTNVRLGWLWVCSAVFYSWWSVKYAALLIVLTGINYGFGRWIREGDRLRLTVGVAFNLFVLGSGPIKGISKTSFA
jgi:hypothetical protein